MVKVKSKSDNPKKLDKVVKGPEGDENVKPKKQVKNPKNGNLEKKVKNVLSNENSKKSKKNEDILQALTVKNQIAEVKDKGDKKKNKKKPKKAPKKTGEGDEPISYEAELPKELVSREVLLNAIKATKEGIAKELENKESKELFDEELKYGLEVIFTKVPKIPTHARRVSLKHSLHPEDPDICLIVKDDKDDKERNDKKDHQKNIDKYEKILKKLEVTCVKTIIPISKLRQDYGPHAMKLKLLNAYDIFLVEPEVADHAYTILGKHFIQKRKRPLQIDFNKKSILKDMIEKSVLKVAFKISGKSNITSIAVGSHKMDDENIAENVETVLEQLKEKFPGGWMNIKRIYYYPLRPSKIHLPIYYSKIDPNTVDVPVEKGYKQDRLDLLSEKLGKKSKKVKIEKTKVVGIKNKAKPGTKKAAAGENPDTDKKKKKNKRKRKENKKETTGESTNENGQENTEPPAKKNKKNADKKQKQENGTEQNGSAEVVEAKDKPKQKNKKKKGKLEESTENAEVKKPAEEKSDDVQTEKPVKNKKNKPEAIEKAANGKPGGEKKIKKKKNIE